jgi:MtrB/PioB family decaheme-associated outer membrane protein
MKTNKEIFAASKLTLAVRGALIVMLVFPLGAYAEDDDVAALTHPTNSVEVGVGNTTKDSAKFGEYNGLDKKGANLIGNFKVRGGDAYNSYDGGDGINRWEIKGTDLGTTSRELGGTYSKQGQWDFGFKYDELQHNFGSIQTPLQGSMGGNSFIMPQGFGIVDTRNPSGVTFPATNGINAPYGAQALTPTQQSYFHTVDVHSNRKNTTLTIGHEFDQQWSMRFELGHLDQSGAKLMMSSTDFQNKAPVNLLSGTSGAPTKEAMQMLMNPTNYKTDTLNLALNWLGEKGHFTGSYYLSQFKAGYSGVSFSNPMVADSVGSTVAATVWPNGTALGGPFPVDMLSTAPDNMFQQLNLNGGYNLTQDTKLVGGVSYGRNTQNMAYINQDQMQVTNQTTKDLALTAGLKFNDHDNKTASNTYKFIDLGGATETSISTPMSNKKTQYELAGDYRIDSRQKLHLGYEYEQINRWCNSSPTAAQIAAASPALGSGTTAAALATAYYAQGNSCVQVPKSKENKLVANYRLKASDDVSFTAGYAYSQRKADVNAAFYNPMQANAQGFELPGYRAFFDASRKEQLVKAGVNWQASEKLNVGLNGRFVNDSYTDSALGVQSGHVWGANLDGAYSLSEKSSVGAYVSVQNRKRDLNNDQWGHTAAAYGTTLAGSGSLTQPWSNRLTEDETTVGLSAKEGELMGGKLDLSADLTYSLSKSGYTTTDNWVNAACTTASVSGYACGATPDIKSKLIQFKVAGDYKLDKASKVRVGYLYQNLKSTDYYYNAYQMGYTPTSLMPTNQQAPSYSVSVITASYLYNF